ncbi:MAG: EthD domain-containing protein [Acidimicrobiia bacterium]|nr:EthD domain-containing protein [Acidimicrobiia bacterium]
MRKLQLLLVPAEGQSLNLLEARLVAEGQALRSRLDVPGRLHRRAIRLPDDPFATTAHGAEVVTGFAAMMELAVPDEAGAQPLIDAVEGCAERLEGLGARIDATASAALIGTEHVIVPGEEPVALFYALRRLPTLDPEGFRDHWLHRHAELGRAVPGLRGYRQVHADPEASKAAAAAAGVGVHDFDGVAEAYYADVEDFLGIMAKPEVTADALEDEKRFIDHSRSTGMLTRIAYRVRD